MRTQQRNLILFVILSTLVIFGWSLLFKPPPGPDYAALMKQGQEAMAAKKYDDAIKAYTQALRVKPNDPDATAALKLAQDALKAFKEAQAARPRPPAGWDLVALQTGLGGLVEPGVPGYVRLAGVVAAPPTPVDKRLLAQLQLRGRLDLLLGGPAAGTDAFASVAGNLLVAYYQEGTKPKWTLSAEKKAEPSLPAIILGSESKDSPYFLGATLSARGAAVRRLILNRFEKADDRGRPVPGQPVELIGEDLNRAIGSNLLYHSPNPDESGERPLNTLGEVRVWDVESAPTVGKIVRVSPTELVLAVRGREFTFAIPSELSEGGGSPGEPKDLEGQEKAVVWSSRGGRLAVVAVLDPRADDDRLRKAVFSTEVQEVKLTKTFTLAPGDYHLGLDVKIELRPDFQQTKFRYFLTSGHGLPIEGDWYTHTFRNALVGLVDQNGYCARDLQDLRSIVHKGGGDQVFRKGTPRDAERRAIQYGGISTQFFASMVVVNDPESGRPDIPKMILDRATPTILSTRLLGRVHKLIPGESDGLVEIEVQASADRQIYPVLVPREAVGELAPGVQVGLVCVWTAKDRLVAQEVAVGAAADSLRYQWIHDDIGVNLVSDLIKLGGEGQPRDVTHRYLLYNGPLKVRLLGQLAGEDAVRGDLVSTWSGQSLYLDRLHLNTLTDAPWQWWGQGCFTGLGLTALFLWTTNLMHSILWGLHWIIPWWGLCIILLTVLVRGAMHPLSRKATLNQLKMQALQPELKKLREKYKDNAQALGMAQMELYRKHKVSLFGSCWTMLLQMPIFMGLYWCLQESIHFRLAPFIPGFTGWIPNLAAPDMLFNWEWMPFVANPANYGSFFYLGPYFNLLPIVAAGLMLVVQKMMMPPATTEQEEMQQRMMKWMPILMGVIFFKIASGIVIYFIASSLWGLMERKLLLPKKHPGQPTSPEELEKQESKPGILARLMERASEIKRAQQEGPAGGMPTTAPKEENRGETGSRKNRKQRKKDRQRQRKQGTSPASPASTGANGKSFLDKVKAWWRDVLKKASKQ